jgi:hypothetical protein
MLVEPARLVDVAGVDDDARPHRLVETEVDEVLVDLRTVEVRGLIE